METFKNIHLGKDIYVIGSGKSVDFFPLSFFDGKVTIGVNQVFKKIVPTYLVRKEHKLLADILKLNLDTIHFVSRGEAGSHGDANKEFVEKGKFENVVVFDHELNICDVRRLPPRDDQLIVSYSTITSAIHLAAHMGAKNIILLGHDSGTLDGKCNFEGYHTEKTMGFYWKEKHEYEKWLRVIDKGTIRLKHLLYERYGCNVVSLNPFINFGLEGHVYKR